MGVGFAAHQLAPPFPPMEQAAPAPSASASAETSASAATSADSAPTASAAVPAEPAEKPSLCMKRAFPDKTFTDEPALEFVCDEANAVKGASRLKEAVVNAGNGKTTPGMKEWAMLGFYELSTYAALRGRCCPAEPAFDVPDPPDKCEAMKAVLGSIAKAAKAGASDADATAATKAFTESVKCHVRAKMTKSLGGYPTPTGGEGTAFEKIYGRLRGVAPAEGGGEKPAPEKPAPEKPAPEKPAPEKKPG